MKPPQVSEEEAALIILAGGKPCIICGREAKRGYVVCVGCLPTFVSLNHDGRIDMLDWPPWVDRVYPGWVIRLRNLAFYFACICEINHKEINNVTRDEMMQVVNDNNVREKILNSLKRHFPKDTGDAEDWVQRALIRMFKHATDLYDAKGVEGYLYEAAMSVALHDKERQAERRETLRKMPRVKARRDPMRHIDYKVDLENAIRRTTREQVLQAALWEIHFEKATWDDVLKDMPQTKRAEGWHSALRRANAALRKEMKRKGY